MMGLDRRLIDKPSSSSIVASKWWNKLWGLGIPPKVKVFWWRVIHNILATSFNLRVHHVPANPCCGICGYGVYTTVHALFLCPFIKPIWTNTDMAQCLQAAKGNSMWDVVIWASSCWSKEKFEVFALCVWEVWNLRNKWTHGGDYRLLGNEYVSVGSMLEEFRQCRQAVRVGLPSTSLVSQSWVGM
ncbi:hypothetical protein UlMin_001817 [Ulmus minor]